VCFFSRPVACSKVEESQRKPNTETVTIKGEQ
jgi:hypothetical protein